MERENKDYKILIVEDDLTIAKTLAESLGNWGYQVTYITDFKSVKKQFINEKPHLVLLDISLPYYDGYYIGSEIRKLSKVPIIYISSMSDNMNIVMAIHMGGDDFIAKPFDLNVVIAKIQALLRRTYTFGKTMNVIEYKGIVLNLGDASVTYGENTIELTKNELKILHMLLENGGNVLSRDAIMTKLWESDSYIDDNTLTVNMTRLRKRLSEIGLEELIVTKKGLGYKVR